MSRRTRRTQRVDELLKQEIARVIRDLKDPRIDGIGDPCPGSSLIEWMTDSRWRAAAEMSPA